MVQWRCVNLERRKALGQVIFDVAKYLVTTTAVGTFVVKEVNFVALAIAVTFSVGLMAIAYYVTPLDKES
jgi:hypothetical protein